MSTHPRAPASSRGIAGIGRVLLWGGGSLWIGHAAGSGNVHAHHAIQISLALGGRLKLRTDRGDWTEYQGAIVCPHHRHQFDGCGGSVAQLFVEPETVLGRALLARYAVTGIHALPGEVIQPLMATLRSAYDAHVTDAALIAIGRQSIEQLAGGLPLALEVDPRITRVIDWLEARRGIPVALAEGARVAHLSSSHFRHLFMAQTGMSFRAYLLWTRVAAAIGAAMGGMSWTDAAQEWGFADSAHLSRTCRRMFGIAPTMLIREEVRSPSASGPGRR